MTAIAGFLATGLFIDGFAGGGGASTGIEQAIGRSVDIAVNHSPSAIAIHKANHPGTTHYCQDIRAIWPAAVTRMQPVAGAWFSPDCKEFSKAKGAPVKDRSIRSLADEVVVWLKEVKPTVAYLVRKFLRGKWVEQRLTIAEQISAIGNSVCPPVARALVAANQPGIAEMRLAA